MNFDFVNATPEQRRVNRHTHSVIQQRATKVGAKTRQGKAARAQSRASSEPSLIKNAELTASVKSDYEQQFGKDGVALALQIAQPTSMANTLASLDIPSFQKDLRTKLLNSESFYAPSKLCKVLQFTDHKFLQYLPSSYGHCPCLDAAISSLMARVGDLPHVLPEFVGGFDDNLNIVRRSSTSFLYNQALKLLQTAIDTNLAKQMTEIWYATMLLTLFELISPSDEQSWVFHAAGAMHVLRAVGPERITSEFQMSLLLTQCTICVIETLMLDRTCYLSEEPWQAALRSLVLYDRPFGERSQARISLWCLNAQIPDLFHSVTRAVKAQEQDDQLRAKLEQLIRDYGGWNTTWPNLHDAVELSESTVLDKDFVAEMNIVYNAFSAIVHRLRVALQPSESLRYEDQAQGQSLNVLLKHDVNSIATGSTFAQGLFGLQVMTALTSTHDKWIEAIQNASVHVPVDAGLFEDWTRMFGRTS